MRYAVAILLVSAVVSAATLAGKTDPAWSQTAQRARLRPVAPPPSPSAASPAAPAPAYPIPPARLTLRRLPARLDATPACRVQCAQTRFACEAVAQTCAPEWTRCLQRCRP